jgi:hypothetical protein
MRLFIKKRLYFMNGISEHRARLGGRFAEAKPLPKPANGGLLPARALITIFSFFGLS